MFLLYGGSESPQRGSPEMTAAEEKCKVMSMLLSHRLEWQPKAEYDSNLTCSLFGGKENTLVEKAQGINLRNTLDTVGSKITQTDSKMV